MTPHVTNGRQIQDTYERVKRSPSSCRNRFLEAPIGTKNLGRHHPGRAAQDTVARPHARRNPPFLPRRGRYASAVLRRRGRQEGRIRRHDRAAAHSRAANVYLHAY